MVNYHDGSFNNQYITFITHHGGISCGERMRIDKDGNVGIGTNSSSKKLTVAGTIQSTSGGFKFPDGTEQVTAGQWPPGSYCIFANGACPSDFTRKSGYLRAISLYHGTNAYIQQVTFGSSNIRCHGNCGQYGSWTGELNLEICCK